MALLTWAGLLPTMIGLAYVFRPLRLPFLVQAVLSTAMLVAALTWIIMPGLTRALRGWLQR